VPACALADAESGIVLIKHLRGARTLLDVLASDFSELEGIYPILGAELARIHRAGAEVDVTMPPAIPSLPELDPVDARHWCSWPIAAQNLVRTLQERQALCGCLRQALDDRSLPGLVHGDMKLNNVLWTDHGVVFLDWELCGRGCRTQDLAGLAGSLLVAWSDALRLEQGDDPERWVRGASVPFPGVARAVRAMLASYGAALAGAELPGMGALAQHTAAWVVGRTWADTFQSYRLTARHRLRLLVAENLLARPGELFAEGP
jgi:hypothetical protein